MPCYDGRDHYTWEDGQREIEEVRKELVPLLCSACTALERQGYNFSENPQLDRWWHRHKLEDKRRQQQELEAQAKLAREQVEKKLAIEWANTKKVSELSTVEIALMKKHGVL